MNRAVIFIAGVIAGAVAVVLLSRISGREHSADAMSAPVSTASTVTPLIATTPVAEPEPELARLRGEVTRLRTENAELRLTKPVPVKEDVRPPVEGRPSFKFPYISRDTWNNAGLGTPTAAIQTFLWAFANRDQAALTDASATQTNGQPFTLTGMATDWADRLLGAQVLSISTPDPKDLNVWHATMVTETRSQRDGGEGLSHGVLTVRLVREDGQWRFAGRVR